MYFILIFLDIFIEFTYEIMNSGQKLLFILFSILMNKYSCKTKLCDLEDAQQGKLTLR